MVAINLETVSFNLFGVLGILSLLLQDCLPFGGTGGFHLLRYLGFAIVHYGFTLKCLEYETLRFVQNSGNNVIKH